MHRVILFIVSAALLAGSFQAEAAVIPKRVASEASGQPEYVLQENALFFSALTSIAVTLSISNPLFGFVVHDINLNLLTRHAQDAAGRQIVVCRLGGVVRSNNNVEMDVLDSDGSEVGRMFYGPRSGDLLFYDAFDQLIIRGFVDGTGRFYLSDLRLNSDERSLASGRFNWYKDYPGFEFYWYDGRNELLSRGLIFFFLEGSYVGGIDRIRTRWMGEDGGFGNGNLTEIEAEYDLRREATGALNSNLFDFRKSAASFFQHPYDLLPPPPGLAWLPRVTDSTWISIANNSGQEARVSLTARGFDGSLLRGTGVRNPVTYSFDPGQQFAAPPADFFQDYPAGAAPPLLPVGALPIWVEIASEQKEISVTHFDSKAEEGELLAASSTGHRRLLFDGLRSSTATQIELSILNPSYSASYISLTAGDAAGETLASADRFYIPARGFRNFVLGAFPELFPNLDITRIATLRAEGPHEGPGLAGVLVRREQEMFEMAADRDESDGEDTIWVPFFVTGGVLDEQWTTWLTITAGTSDETSLEIEGFSFDGNSLFEVTRTLRGRGSRTFSTADLLPIAGEGVTRGYLKIIGSGKIYGRVSYRFDSRAGGSAAGQALSPHPYFQHTFQEISNGMFGGELLYSGVALLNVTESPAAVILHAVDNEGRVIAEGTLSLGPHTATVVLLGEVFGPGFELLGGKLKLDSTSPIYGLALSGNARGTLLTTIPATERR